MKKIQNQRGCSIWFALFLVIFFVSGAVTTYAKEATKTRKVETVPTTKLNGRENKQEGKPITSEDKGKPSNVAYEVIVEKNLFNPLRMEKWEEKKDTAPLFTKNRGVKTLSAFVLEGVIMFGDYNAALIKDKAKMKDGVKTVKVGDSLGNYKVESIREEHVVLREGDGTEVVLPLYTSDKSLKRRHVKTETVQWGLANKRPKPTRRIPARPAQKGFESLRETAPIKN